MSIGKAVGMVGVATSTLRRRDVEGKLVAERTPGLNVRGMMRNRCLAMSVIDDEFHESDAT